MIRFVSASAAALLLTATVAVARDGHTTRVVRGDVYGATVTVEEGVRVFRPLPSDRHVIVKPEGSDNVEIEIRDYTVTPGGIRR
ncbi:hypothetical protein W911_05755 [Hyphomicrobium nitrativorans NL23]|uniref:Uncharacterized protein n=1 Tax=Hyphomicrobium nitrativorans NL23 TaxID=1029756 RepID=V5SB10_9HYPH|nr:hypothetical protein [Hyphomicrobium nitrativorans]AHB48016.1 hypothetical protein W911_05755 [Hyphomicrobium nitrativorans NL23]